MGFDLFCPFSVSYTLEQVHGKTQPSVRFIITSACDNTVVDDIGKLTQVSACSSAFAAHTLPADDPCGNGRQ